MVGTAIVFSTVSCTTKTPRQTTLMRQTDLTISSATLRIQVRSLADRHSGLMEKAGEAVLAQEDDPRRRRHALMWLTNGIPAMQQALFQPDPLAALLDAWFLIAQMRGYFDSGHGHEDPPVYSDLAHAMLDEMESDFKLILDSAGGEQSYERSREFVYSRAAEVPVDRGFAARRGSTIFLAEFTTKAGGGVFQSIGSITETAEDLVARIDLNAEYIPKLARWHAMLFALDGGYDTLPEAAANLEYIEMVALEVERLAPLLEELPTLVSEERIAVLTALDDSLSRTLRFIDQQRSTLMHEDLRAEREAVLAAVSAERMALLAAIAEERRVVLEAVSAERQAAFRDLDGLVDKALTRELNKMFIRGLILIAIALAGFAAITYLGVQALKRRSD
jgi:hypothetical protein